MNHAMLRTKGVEVLIKLRDDKGFEASSWVGGCSTQRLGCIGAYWLGVLYGIHC